MVEDRAGLPHEIVHLRNRGRILPFQRNENVTDVVDGLVLRMGTSTPDGASR
jgi:hypothetical protein